MLASTSGGRGWLPNLAIVDEAGFVCGFARGIL